MNRSVRLLRIITPIVAIICIVVFPPWNEVFAWLAPLPDSVQAQVDNAIGQPLDGIMVYVDQAGRPPAFYAAGWKNKAERVPADPHALFKIGSISKLYIAVAAAKLVASGSLSLDETLADRLPDLGARIEFSDQITLRMMLRHRSGLPNFTADNDFDWSKPQTNNGNSLALVLDEPADFKPGSQYRYSNTNYLLLGLVLDKVLGFSHREYIEREILVPAGLTETYGLLADAEYGDVASGYWVNADDDLRGLDYSVPGGSMVATAQDVGTFLRALNDGSLLNEDEQAIYTSIYEFGHTGWLPGFYSIARYHEAIDAVVIQFVNTTGGNTIMMADIVYSRIVKILSRG